MLLLAAGAAANLGKKADRLQPCRPPMLIDFNPCNLGYQQPCNKLTRPPQRAGSSSPREALRRRRRHAHR